MARRTTSKWAAAVLAALVVALLSPLPVSASPTWLPAEPLSGAPFVYTLEARVVMDPAGNATAVWFRTTTGVGEVKASHRPAGGTWTEPVTISDPERIANQADVVVAPDGTVTAAWLATEGSDRRVEGATMTPSGLWSGPGLVAAKAELEAPHLAVDGAGNVTVVFLEYRSPNYVVRASTRPAQGDWTLPVDLSDDAHSSTGAQVAMDRTTGKATAVWQTFDGSDSLIYARQRPLGGAWSSREPISEAGQDAGSSPRVTVDAQGTATVVYPRYLAGVYYAATTSLPVGGTWSTPAPLTPTDDNVQGIAVTADRTGHTVAVWRRDVDGTYVVEARTRAPNGTWSDLDTVSNPATQAASLAAGTSPDGTTYVLWHRFDSPASTLVVSRRPAGGAWTDPQDLAGDSGQALSVDRSIAFDAGSDALVTFGTPSTSGLSVANVRAFDVAGPKVSFSVTGKTFAGTAKLFGAQVVDVWSAVASRAWSFGDGKSATGASVKHTYAKPGKYIVTVTATDSVGNVSSRKVTVTVLAPKPVIRVFALTDRSIRKSGATTLKVKLNTKATLKLVLKGRAHGQRLVLKKKLPKGLSTIAISGRALRPDTYVLTGTATNSSATSPKKRLTLKVVR
jgi:hypothetical protein